MNRKDFIRQLTGGSDNVRNILLWSVIAVIAVLVIDSDWFASTSSLISVLKICGVFLVIILLVSFLLVGLQFLGKKILGLLPAGIKNWISRNKKKLDISFIICLAGALIYYCITKEQYLPLSIAAIFFISSLFNNKKAADHRI